MSIVEVTQPKEDGRSRIHSLHLRIGADQIDALHFPAFFHEQRHDGRGGPLSGIALIFRADRGKSQITHSLVFSQAQALSIAGQQLLFFAALAADPDGPYGMNHIFRRQLVAKGYLGVACTAAFQRPARRRQRNAACLMDGPVDGAAQAQQAGAGRIDDGVGRPFRYISH